ncbi:hypothetical protein BGZ65_004813 [Modicella reniformis]|uniref:Uncharacterized protein n=1 Tax=Modicella reniformis TaxID=1440133 RepID=A0A9P6MBD1_9FUNG|nr:hypothetical protein BGZ65_004813 [Modicella reniformis]
MSGKARMIRKDVKKKLRQTARVPRIIRVNNTIEINITINSMIMIMITINRATNSQLCCHVAERLASNIKQPTSRPLGIILRIASNNVSLHFLAVIFTVVPVVSIVMTLVTDRGSLLFEKQ